jgi:hypothetical protein
VKNTPVLPTVLVRLFSCAVVIVGCLLAAMPGGAQPRAVVSLAPTSSPTTAASTTPDPYSLDANPLFGSDAYYYRGDDNNPKLHPIPPEMQTGPPRDWHIRCIDWSRMLRKGKPVWHYFVTTCECWSSAQLRYFPSPAPRQT